MKLINMVHAACRLGTRVTVSIHHLQQTETRVPTNRNRMGANAYRCMVA